MISSGDIFQFPTWQASECKSLLLSLPFQGFFSFPPVSDLRDCAFPRVQVHIRVRRCGQTVLLCEVWVCKAIRDCVAVIKVYANQ